MARRLFYCDHHEIALPEGHKFPAQKYRMLREQLATDGRFTFEPAPVISVHDLGLAHDPAYVRRFLEGTLDPMLMRRIGFPWSESLVRRTLASVGGTMAAAQQALRTGFGGTLAGGTHHAFRSEGAGFCVFNDIAVAALALRRDGLAARVAVVDVDVHQGDGTAHIFREDPNVLTISIHGSNNFPFRKQRGRVDIDLADGTGDVEYLDALQSAMPVVVEYKPQLIFYLAGVDTLAGDRLGRLALTHQGLVRRDQAVLETAREYGIPLIIALGGGYSEPIERTVEAHANTFRVAADTFGDSPPLQPFRP